MNEDNQHQLDLKNAEIAELKQRLHNLSSRHRGDILMPSKADINKAVQDYLGNELKLSKDDVQDFLVKRFKEAADKAIENALKLSLDASRNHSNLLIIMREQVKEFVVNQLKAIGTVHLEMK